MSTQNLLTQKFESDAYTHGSVHEFDGKFYWFESEQWPEAGWLSGGFVGPFDSKTDAEADAGVKLFTSYGDLQESLDGLRYRCQELEYKLRFVKDSKCIDESYKLKEYKFSLDDFNKAEKKLTELEADLSTFLKPLLG